ncbi:hypothetical protein PsYK624_062320 [Phanerochaete sordida]|uniref:Uncharacterized protein n=1 Tax=Phanerochaete sordida TaxID=48140 RepID=A0A9P3GA12_9APHY|nr:hypothetical protein PsYK624_062320 [Phanerochaete sordida]
MPCTVQAGQGSVLESHRYTATSRPLGRGTEHALAVQTLIRRIAIVSKRRRDAHKRALHPCCDLHPLAVHRHLHPRTAHHASTSSRAISRSDISAPTHGQTASTIPKGVPQRWLSENLCDTTSPLTRTRRASQSRFRPTSAGSSDAEPGMRSRGMTPWDQWHFGGNESVFFSSGTNFIPYFIMPFIPQLHAFQVIVSPCISASFAHNVGTHIFVDDLEQLRPVIQLSVACALGLERSYLERVTELDSDGRRRREGCTVVQPAQNLRSHPAIFTFPSELFYEDTS